MNERELQLRIAQFLLNTGCYSNVYLEYMLPVSVFPTNTHKYLNTHNFSLCHGITWRVKNWLNNQTATAKGRPDIVFSGQHPIRPWTKANIGQLNNGSNVTPVFKYTYNMKSFHKILFVLAIFIANCISASAIEFTVDGVRYSVNNDNTTVTVVGYPLGSKPTGDLTIPESVTFGGISFPVTSIGKSAFEYCSGLTSVTIPGSVTSIGVGVFFGCSGLKRIDAYPNPAKVSMGSDVFYIVPKDGTLHVLRKYLSAYQTASQWKDFYNIKADLTETDGIEEVRVDELDHTLPMNVYNMNGVKMGDRLEGLPAGIYIVHQGGKSAKVMK